MKADDRGTGFDGDALLERLDGDRRLARELIRAFLEESPTLLAELRGAVPARNAREVVRTAHSLRGALLHLSAAAAAAHAERLEASASRGDLDACPGLQQALEAEIARLELTLRAMLDGL
jgi:HPt (histidine-containing phosphotransfer) domain-containing protein